VQTDGTIDAGSVFSDFRNGRRLFAEVTLIKELLFSVILVFVQEHVMISTLCIVLLDVIHMGLLVVRSPFSNKFIQVFEVVITGATALQFVVVYLLGEYQWPWLYWIMVDLTLFVVTASVIVVLVRARHALSKAFVWCCRCCRCRDARSYSSIQ